MAIKPSAALSKYIGDVTREGVELVDVLLNIARGSAHDKIRLEATAMLMDRFAGKPLAVVETVIVQHSHIQNPERIVNLDENQLEALAALGVTGGTQRPAN